MEEKMIDKLKMVCLKSIDILEMECNNLNIIVGTNSSGKSTILQGILLISQNINMKQGLNGEMVSLGEFRDIKNFNKDNTKITITLNDEKENQISISFQEFEKIPKISIIGEGVEEFSKIIDYQTGKLQFLSCNRIGSQDIYQKNFSTIDGIGKNGEYALYYLLQHKKDVLEPNLIKDFTQDTLETQVNYWMDYIIHAKVAVEDIRNTDILKAAYSLIDGKNLRPKNIGAGVSYIASIIIMCLSSKKGDILLIENPEIHLHPLAQSRICEFLYFIAISGRQIFVETHSDHIFNGIRAGIATKKMNRDYINVNFFALNKKNCTENTKIEFGERGRVLNQQEGLFDQFDIDLNRMLGL